MVKKIKLMRDSCVRLYENKPFVMPDGLVIEFDSVYNLSNAVITLKNGELKEKYKFKSVFEIPSTFLFCGELSMTIDMYIDNAKAKTWYVMPIKIIEQEGEIIGFEWLSNLEERIKKLEDAHKIIK